MNNDIIIRGLLADSTVKVMAISGKTLVAEAKRIHGLSRVCTAALGRALLMTSMMGAQLKNADERVTTMLKGGGEAGNIICTADWTGRVKGYLENPTVELPPAPNGKLDVALAVGWFGDLTVVRDMGLKEPYVGTCPIESGEIAEDFARYYTISEQQPSLVYLGVRVNAETGEVLAASGLVAQPLPGCPDEVIDTLTEKAKAIETLTATLEGGVSLKDALMSLFADMDFKITANQYPAFRCDCSRERLERVLISIGEEELADMIQTEHGAELTCHFCNTKYQFDEADLTRLLNEAKGN
ncbi:MAG: Hsp33 family molecular chaperone HslO [Clostridiales bacterium]|nr:Hsp33 family molecular chaperone HslO [Clostridiales bacterium]